MAESTASADSELLAAWARRSEPEEQAWRRAVPGPALADVERRLSSVPQPFLNPRIEAGALVEDILPGQTLAATAHTGDERVRLGLAIGLWLVAADDVLGPLQPPLRAGTSALAVDALALRVAVGAPPGTWLSEAERRTEAARSFLLWCGYLPAGENRRTARALLQACDSLARNTALAAAFEGHRHRAAIAEQLTAARAREAAARYGAE